MFRSARYFTRTAEISKIGMDFRNHADTGALIHVAWGKHLQSEDLPTHAWFNANLASPEFQGPWLAGTKSTGAKHWYGYIHPEGPELPCVDPHAGGFALCRMADGSPCPPEDLTGCCDEEAGTCVSGRGWWSTRFDAQIILYDPTDLGRVAAGDLEPWEPQPYASLDIDEHLYFQPPEWDVPVLGFGNQRRYRIGDAAYDPDHGLLYVLELYASGAKPVVHVWSVM